MGKNMIRNGGFERGNTDFWDGQNGSAFEVVTTPVHAGTYAVKIVAQTGPSPTIKPNDYFEIGLDETAALELWLRGSAAAGVHLWMYFYDEELILIKSFRVVPFNLSTTEYVQYLFDISGIEGSKYFKPMVYFNATVIGQVLYLDSVSLYKSDPKTSAGRTHQIYKSGTLNSAGTYYSDMFYVAPFTQGEFKLWVDSCLGTSETVDVTIESKSLYDEQWHTIATFTQVTVSDVLQVIVLSAGLGGVLRSKTVIGGNPSSVDLDITGNFKR